MIAIMRKLTYDCDLALDLNCYGPSGDLYTCEPGSQNGAFTTCEVNGQEVLAVSQGIHPDESYWRTFGYLFALFAGFRLGSLFFMYYPFQKVVFAVQRWWYSPYILEALVKSKLQIMKLEERVLRLVKQANVPNWEGESNNVRRCAVEEDPKNNCAGRSGSGGGGEARERHLSTVLVRVRQMMPGRWSKSAVPAVNPRCVCLGLTWTWCSRRGERSSSITSVALSKQGESSHSCKQPVACMLVFFISEMGKIVSEGGIVPEYYIFFSNVQKGEIV